MTTSIGPLQKYEEAFGVSGAVDWEVVHHRKASGGKSWEGHCNIAALASIAFVPPPSEGVVHKGVAFACEQLKLLAAEIVGQYADLHDVWTPLAFSQDPEDLRSKKPSEDPESFGRAEMLVKFLDHLRTWMRLQGHALAMDLRDATGRDPEEVWNHAVFHYRTKFWQPDPDDPTLTEGEVELLANADKWGNEGNATGVPATVVISRHRDSISTALQSSEQGNPRVRREDVLQLMRLRSRYEP